MADFSIKDNIAIIEVNHPPVNALSTGVRSAISRRIEDANQDSNVQAIVLCGKGRTFPAGADIKEFASLREKRDVDPVARATDSVIEGSIKPVIAAVHGSCLGGGLELALSAHFRIALPSARFGFPEVLIGLLPGLGGTQRLPRLVGMQKAMDIIVSGRHIKAKEALEAGLLDKVIKHDNIKQAGIDFAREVLAKGIPKKITSRMPVQDAALCKHIVNGTQDMVKRRMKGLLAPQNCIKAVEACVTSPSFEAGIKRERQLFAELFSSSQAKGLQYAFLAEREAQKWGLASGENASTMKARPMKTGAVIGGGTMGSGIAMCMLNAGMHVYLIEQNQKFLDKGVAAVHGLYQGSVKLGRMSEAAARKCLSLLTPTTKYQDLASVDIVVEAVFENMKVKKQIFEQLSRYCKGDAILCSNTSSLDIDQIASATSCPDRVIGAHFFAPSYYMKLLEVVRGAKTTPQTIANVFAYGKQIGKIPVLVGNCHGFVGNRMMAPYTSEAKFVVEDGALPHQVDQVIEDYGFALGPFKVGDLSGLDIGWNITKELCQNLGVTYTPRMRSLAGNRFSPIAGMLCEMGRFGRKSGAGWYQYEKVGGKKATIDQSVIDLIERYCREEGITRRQISPEEVIERCLYSLINEGFKILEEGIAFKPQDIDTIWNLGYGWPRQTGGPMFLASQIGLGKIYDRISSYYKLSPTTGHWKPSRLLQRLATSAPAAPISTWTTHLSKL